MPQPCIRHFRCQERNRPWKRRASEVSKTVGNKGAFSGLRRSAQKIRSSHDGRRHNCRESEGRCRRRRHVLNRNVLHGQVEANCEDTIQFQIRIVWIQVDVALLVRLRVQQRFEASQWSWSRNLLSFCTLNRGESNAGKCSYSYHSTSPAVSLTSVSAGNEMLLFLAGSF